jgi:hypothetical protein
MLRAATSGPAAMSATNRSGTHSRHINPPVSLFGSYDLFIWSESFLNLFNRILESFVSSVL